MLLTDVCGKLCYLINKAIFFISLAHYTIMCECVKERKREREKGWERGTEREGWGREKEGGSAEKGERIVLLGGVFLHIYHFFPR